MASRIPSFRPKWNAKKEDKPAYRNRDQAERSSFYGSKAWQSTRLAFLMYPENALCAKCKRPANTVHHKVERLSLEPWQWLDWEFLESLCSSCHTKHHNEQRKNK